MTPKNRSVFLDTSVIFAAVLSRTGGVRKIFLLGEEGVLKLVIGPAVLRECDEVVRRKAPTSLSTLAQLLDIGWIKISPAPSKELVEVEYGPDAHVLAEAMRAGPDWFVTHNKEHFLKKGKYPAWPSALEARETCCNR
jgi:predicted nucleic acid-binding protein